MDGFIANILKYLILFANLILFVAGCIVFTLSIWVLADSPEFLKLFDKAKDVVGDDADNLSLNIYTTTTYIFISLSAFVVIVAFFGCCGAWKESKCMLGTYFAFVLVLFLMLITGGVLAYAGNLKSSIKAPLLKSVSKYDDNPTENPKASAYKEVWNEIMKDMKCCGVNNAGDWKNATNNWSPSTSNKPEGCCAWQMVAGEWKDISTDVAAVKVCREAAVPVSSAMTSEYYWDGCFSKFETKVENNKAVVVWGSSISAVVMVLTLLFTLGLCMMAE